VKSRNGHYVKLWFKAADTDSITAIDILRDYAATNIELFPSGDRTREERIERDACIRIRARCDAALATIYRKLNVAA